MALRNLLAVVTPVTQVMRVTLVTQVGYASYAVHASYAGYAGYTSYAGYAGWLRRLVTQIQSVVTNILKVPCKEILPYATCALCGNTVKVPSAVTKKEKFSVTLVHIINMLPTPIRIHTSSSS